MPATDDERFLLINFETGTIEDWLYSSTNLNAINKSTFFVYHFLKSTTKDSVDRNKNQCSGIFMWKFSNAWRSFIDFYVADSHHLEFVTALCLDTWKTRLFNGNFSYFSQQTNKVLSLWRIKEEKIGFWIKLNDIRVDIKTPIDPMCLHKKLDVPTNKHFHVFFLLDLTLYGKLFVQLILLTFLRAHDDLKNWIKLNQRTRATSFLARVLL